MPASKNPLYHTAREYIDGSNSSELTTSELASLEAHLESELEVQLFIGQTAIRNVPLPLSKTEPDRIDFGDKPDKTYLHYLSSFKQACGASYYPMLALHKIKRIQAANLSIRLGAKSLTSDVSEGKTLKLMGGYIRSSTLIKKYYSKLFKETMDLTDHQWNLIETLFSSGGVESAGRPPQPVRAVLNGIFWKLRTGATWNDLPLEYPSHQTCYRYFSSWIKDGRLDKIMQILQSDLKANGLDLYLALKNSEIDMIRVSRQTVIRFAPRLRETWQGSTALLLLQVLLAKSKKEGQLLNKAVQVHPLTFEEP